MNRPTQRQKKKQLTREVIVQQAFRLFLEKGFDSVTIEDIAEAANISRRTVFRYFPSKELIVFPTHQQKLQLLKNWLMEFKQQHGTLAAVRLALLEMSKYFETTRQHVLDQHTVIKASDVLIRFENQIDMDWADCIARFVRQYEPDQYDVFSAKVLANALIGGIRVAYRSWINGGCRVGEFQRLGADIFNILRIE